MARKTKKSDKRTYVAFVLDESGSMSVCRDQTIDGFNEQVNVVKANADKGGETTVSLFKFGSAPDSKPKEVYFNEEPSALLKLSRETYEPHGVTPMYDAVGMALSKLQTFDAEGDIAFLVIVVSDGLENASKEWTGAKLADHVKKLQDNGRWTFVYLGANQDLADVEKHLGIKGGNTMAYASTPQGAQALYAATAANVSSYMQNVRGAGLTNTASFNVQQTDEDKRRRGKRS